VAEMANWLFAIVIDSAAKQFLDFLCGGLRSAFAPGIHTLAPMQSNTLPAPRTASDNTALCLNADASSIRLLKASLNTNYNDIYLVTINIIVN
jgi:hypothetical protein